MLAPSRLFLLSLLPGLLAAALAPAADPTYWQDIRPVLRKHCTVCHSQRNLQELEVSGGLTLDSYQAVLKNTRKALLVAGKSDQSLLIQTLVTSNEEKRMPLGLKPLSPELIALLRRWVDSGAREGTKPDSETTVAAAPSPPPRTRKLDVSLNTSAVPQAGVFGPGAVSALRLSLRVGPLAPVPAVVFSPDGRLLAAGAYGRVTLWDLEAGRPIKVLTNVLAAVNDIRFSPDGKLLAVAGGQPSARGDLRIYQTSDWKLLAVLAGHDDVVASIAFSPDGKKLASASYDRTVRIWNVATLKHEQTLTGHSDFVNAVAWGPDGQWLVSGGKDRSVKLVEAATAKSRLTFSDRDRDIFAVAVSPDGTVVASGEEPGLSWWNSKTGERLRSTSGHSVGVNELVFSKDGKLLLSAGGDGTLRLWNGTAGTPIKTLAVGSMVYSAALDLSGRRAASGSFDGMVRIWDTATGRLLATLLALPPQGDRLDYLVLTPEGAATTSPELLAQGQWFMGNSSVPAPAVWKNLLAPDLVRKALKGETITTPTFTK